MPSRGRTAGRNGKPQPDYPAAPDLGPPLAVTRLQPDPVLLFCYSALTFDGHRIHYGRSYATGVEGYDDLVVHGPLQADAEPYRPGA